MKYNKVFVTNLPSFYKINLYNKISEETEIFVIFLYNKNNERNQDFYIGNKCFKNISLGDYYGVIKLYKLFCLIKSIEYEYVILGGWDSIYYWAIALFSPKNKNGLVIESSIFESKTIGIRAKLKSYFVKRISHCFPSGKPHLDLINKLGFKGESYITGGVGLYNRKSQPKFIESEEVKNFIYVGRLVHVKNLKLLINVFNHLPQFKLSIVGFGPLLNELKELAGSNIYFLGAVKNKELYKYYKSNDVFILPSLSETWGLVVEEALNNGLPVIVSNKVGCCEDLVSNGYNGLIFEIEIKNSLEEAIIKIADIDFYNFIKQNVTSMDFEKIEKNQIMCYLN